MSGIAQKVKDTVTPNNNTHTTSTTGHHDTATPRTTTVPGGTTAGGPAPGTHYTSGTTGTTGTTGYTHTAGGPAPNTDGPHKSDMMNRADPRIDSDRDHSKNLGLNSSGTAATGSLANSQTANRDIGAPGIGGTTATHPVGTSATHGSSMTANHGPTGPSGGTIGNTHHTTGGLGSHTTTSTGTREGEFGPHGGRLANAADPRVDSDLDGSKRFGGNTSTTTGTTGGLGSSHHTTGTTAGIGSTGRTTGTTGTSGDREGDFGPHYSRLANAADPRVDSDLDNTRHAGATRTTGTTGTTGGLGTSHHTTGTTAGIGSTGRTTGTTGTSGVREGEFGPHSGRVANAADPRVDSDLDGNRNVGGTHTGAPATTGNLGSSHHTTASNTPGTARTAGGIGGTTHTTGHTTTTTGPGSKTTGPAPNTAGPHKSDMLNKIDPRVDSNLDGSKTVGGDKTHAADRRI